ncbi:MAG: hypothetical protein HYY36_01050 [Gammaproteobacteria bacterium]|nr:hypothetical protein [Gammaproteobacteria bacterium]
MKSISDTRAKVTIEPLNRGFGHTLGNALRRVLLSSMSSCAVTEVENRLRSRRPVLRLFYLVRSTTSPAPWPAGFPMPAWRTAALTAFCTALVWM